MKVGVLAKRERGQSATPSEWETRELPKPTVVSAFAAIESKEEFLERCQNERRRVGVVWNYELRITNYVLRMVEEA